MTDATPDTTVPPSPDHSRLADLTSQSWNLELIISGAALFATLALPDLVTGAFGYYRYNLMIDDGLLHGLLPILIYSAAEAISYVLFAAFLLNFVMRAFWVGLVGLLAVYPRGVQYDRIPFVSRFVQQRHAEELGTLDDYIIRLDRRCNVVFALAFLTAFTFLVILLTYGLVIVLFTVLQWLTPAALYVRYESVLLRFVLGAFMLLALTQLALSLPALREKPRWAAFSYRITRASRVLYWGLYTPIQFLMLTFTSNLPTRTLHRRLAVIYAGFTLIFLAFVSYHVVHEQRPGLFDSRKYFSQDGPEQYADANEYDNQRPADAYVATAAIQADVVREPYLRLFVAYPKPLDAELSKRYSEPVWPDTLKRKEKREKQAAWRLATLGKFITVMIDDSLHASPDWLFTQRNEQQDGLMAVLPTGYLKPGKHLVQLMKPDSTDKPEPFCRIPFWYVPEN